MRFLLLALLLFVSPLQAQERLVTATTILNAITVTPTTGDAVENSTGTKSFHGKVTGTGAVTATIVVEGSNENSTWVTIGTITLSGTTSATDGFAHLSAWRYVRGRISALTGTGATATLVMGR